MTSGKNLLTSPDNNSSLTGGSRKKTAGKNSAGNAGKTTVSLSGQPPLEPTHKLIDLNVPFETVAVALFPAPSEFKLKTLTAGNGGLAFPSSIGYYQTMLAQRLAIKIESVAETGTSTESGTLAAKTGVSTEASEDLFPEIPR